MNMSHVEFRGYEINAISMIIVNEYKFNNQSSILGQKLFCLYMYQGMEGRSNVCCLLRK